MIKPALLGTGDGVLDERRWYAQHEKALTTEKNDDNLLSPVAEIGSSCQLLYSE